MKSRLAPCIAAILSLTACSSAVKAPQHVMTRGEEAAPPSIAQEYRIRPGDVLDIKFFYNPELNENVTVRPDGRISVPLAHEVMVVDMTPARLSEIITEKYSRELKKPEVTVIVRSFAPQGVYVDGEVGRPGLVPLTGTLTVLQAIAQAGGLRDSALKEEVLVIRRVSGGEPVTFRVDAVAAQSRDMSQDMALLPYDTIYVPRSSISSVNSWIDKYIRKNIPLGPGLGLGLGYDINP